MDDREKELNKNNNQVRLEIKKYIKNNPNACGVPINWHSENDKFWKSPANMELVHNFEIDFLIPDYDQQLDNILRQRNNNIIKGKKKIEYSQMRNLKEVTAIYKRIEELKGLLLIWV